MNILLDENISRTLQIDFDKHQVKTIDEMGWAGKKNGELMRLMARHGFDVLLTTDKNIKYQQNIKNFPIIILVLVADNNRDETIQPLIDIARKKLNSKLNKGVVEIKGSN